MPEIQVKCQPASREYVALFLDQAAKRMDECWSVVNIRVGATFDALTELLRWFVSGCEGEHHAGTEAHPNYPRVCAYCDEPWPCPTERARSLLAVIAGQETNE